MRCCTFSYELTLHVLTYRAGRQEDEPKREITVCLSETNNDQGKSCDQSDHGEDEQTTSCTPGPYSFGGARCWDPVLLLPVFGGGFCGWRRQIGRVYGMPKQQHGEPQGKIGINLQQQRRLVTQYRSSAPCMQDHA